MKNIFKIRNAIAVMTIGAAILSFPLVKDAVAQFPADSSARTGGSAGAVPPSGGPVAVGQEMAHRDDGGRVSIVQAPPVVQPTGGVIQLSAFGWLEPYVDSIVQALIAGGLAWLGKSKYGQWMDQSSRDALEAFAKNAANSLIADGAVAMRGKTIHVDDANLAAEVNSASTRIPGALKWFGITPKVIGAKIIDAIPQTTAGGAIVAAAHAVPNGQPASQQNTFSAMDPPTAAVPG